MGSLAKAVGKIRSIQETPEEAKLNDANQIIQVIRDAVAAGHAPKFSFGPEGQLTHINDEAGKLLLEQHVKRGVDMTREEAYRLGFEEKQAQLVRNLRSALVGTSPARSIFAAIQSMPERIVMQKLNLRPPEHTSESNALASEIGRRSLAAWGGVRDTTIPNLNRKKHHLQVQAGSKRYQVPYKLVNQATAVQKAVARGKDADKYDTFLAGKFRPPQEMAREIAMERSSGPKPPLLERLAYRIFG